MRRFLVVAVVAGVVSLLVTGICGILPLANAERADETETDRATTTASTTRAAQADQPDHILHRLMEQAPPITPPSVPGQSVVPGRATSVAAAPVDVSYGEKLLPEGYYIPDRRGRLIRQDRQWLFAFEADRSGKVDSPILLLPNRWLEKMEADSAAATKSMIFRVSGEITEYHGRNYLLIRRFLIERDVDRSLIR